MTDASRYSSLLSLTMIALAIMLPCIAFAVLRAAYAIPAEPPAYRVDASTPVAPVPVSVRIGLDWSVFHGGGAADPTTGRLAQRFRLAGTWLVRGGGGLNIRRAVIDWIERERQEIVSEGDHLEEVVVVRIGDDRIVLREGAQETTLWLSFSGHTGAQGEGADGRSVPDTGVDAATSNRFGRAIGEHNWLFNREALMAYHAELLDDPERLLQVFDSMEPLYDEGESITGYVLDVKGERDFFDDVGFHEGDVVRAVNAVPMTNRGRAENFIQQFSNNNLSVFVIDMERDGRPIRMTYRIR